MFTIQSTFIHWELIVNTFFFISPNIEYRVQMFNRLFCAIQSSYLSNGIMWSKKDKDDRSRRSWKK